MRRRTYVVGVGLTKFTRADSPGHYATLVREAATAALNDAHITYAEVQSAVCGYCFGDPTCGQRGVYELGLTGIPVFNCSNYCSTGSTALMLARQLVEGRLDCVLAVGFEKCEKKGLTSNFENRPSPIERHYQSMWDYGADRAPLAKGMNDLTGNVIKMFAFAARDHMRTHGTTKAHFAKIAYKNHKHSVNNPYALLQEEIPLSTIEQARSYCEPLTGPMSAPLADGAAAVIICSEAFVRSHGLWTQAVEILSQAMVTDLPSSFSAEQGGTAGGYRGVCGVDMAARAAETAFSEANISPSEIDVVELHDCFASNELMLYEALGLCPRGGGGTFVDQGVWIKNTAGGDLFRQGRCVINASGGLESKGHPIGATGVAQCVELCWQLRGQSGKRQVDGARLALQHNFGIGGAAVVTIYGSPLRGAPSTSRM